MQEEDKKRKEMERIDPKNQVPNPLTSKHLLHK